MWNIFDQSNRVTYPNSTSGYWQNPSDAASRDIYEKFPQAFGEFFENINSWSAADYMGGVFLFGSTLYLARVHNGGRDGRGRPQRWTLFVWREDKVAPGHALDLARWLADPKWSVGAVPVPLPAIVPTSVYRAPIVQSKQIPEGELPKGGRVGAGESTLRNPVNNLAIAAKLWAEWSCAPMPRRAENGFLLVASVGGKFQCVHELDLGESETYKAEVAAEKKRREEEERRRREEEERVRREAEEAERVRKEKEAEKIRREEEERRRQKEERRRQRAECLRRVWNSKLVSIAINVVSILLIMGGLALIAWDAIERYNLLDFRDEPAPVQTPPQQRPTSPQPTPMSPQEEPQKNTKEPVKVSPAKEATKEPAVEPVKEIPGKDTVLSTHGEPQKNTKEHERKIQG